jgi:hypothetical protein
MKQYRATWSLTNRPETGDDLFSTLDALIDDWGALYESGYGIRAKVKFQEHDSAKGEWIPLTIDGMDANEWFETMFTLE